MKTTPLTQMHKNLGAKLVDFAGYQMPVQYSSIKEEHQCVRNKVGMFDVSHMGEFIVKGPNAKALIQYVSSNDVNKLLPGKVQYSCLTNPQGGIIDDMLVYHLPDGTYMLVVNASNIEKDWAWIKQQNDEKFGAELIEISAKTGLIAVQGPNATAVLQQLTDMDLTNMKYYTCDKGVFAGAEKVLVSATGYTGAGGFEVYCWAHYTEQIWQAIMEAGKDFGLQAVGLGARDTLRLEKGYCLYGNDIDDTTSPLEAGLGWITKLNTNFIGCEAIKAQKQVGIKRKLIGFEVLDRGIARNGYLITDHAGNNIGRVTSGTQSPTLNKAIGLGYVSIDHSSVDTTFFISVRKKRLKAKVVKIPFVQ